MNIDVADIRELTIYKRDTLCGAPELIAWGVALLPMFGAGAAVLAWSFFQSFRQQFIVSHQQFWFRQASGFGPVVCCDRRQIVGVDVNQTWLQSKFGTGDLIIRCKDMKSPIRICGLSEVKAIQWRLARHLDNANLPPYLRRPVPVGRAPRAPRQIPKVAVVG